MTNPFPLLMVALADGTAFVKISGRANFSSSIDFKTLIGELNQKGIQHFVLDLSDCTTMDSTFLGVLSGYALKMSDKKPPYENLNMELLNPNPRVEDLLENLGVVELFTILREDHPSSARFEPVVSGKPAPTREELSRNCLEAHKILMEANPENIPRFKEVTQFLAEDLKKGQS